MPALRYVSIFIPSTDLTRSVVGQIPIGILRSLTFTSTLHYTRGNCSWEQRFKPIGGQPFYREVENGSKIVLVIDETKISSELRCVVGDAEKLRVVITAYGEPSLTSCVSGQRLMLHYIIIRSR